MYDRPETATAWDRFWALVREALRALGQDAPEGLTRGGDLWAQWQAQDLVLGQTCGLPFRARLRGAVTLVASPDFGLEGCAPGEYCSVLVARAGDARRSVHDFSGAPLAVNDVLSQSGWGAVWAFGQEAGVDLRPVLLTGAHRASARAVAEGRADWASLDAQSWRMMQRWDDWAADLRVIARTPATPGLPFICAPGRDPGPVRAALRAAIAGMDAADRAVLDLCGIAEIPAAAYLALPVPPAPDLPAN